MKALAHPDAGGDHELFLWIASLHEHVAGDDIEPARPRPHRTPECETERVSFEAALGFDALTTRALALSRTAGDPYGGVLALLTGCWEPAHPIIRCRRGASYRQLAYIAHLAGMTTAERSGWYRVAEGVPLADAHAGHIIERLKGGPYGR